MREGSDCSVHVGGRGPPQPAPALTQGSGSGSRASYRFLLLFVDLGEAVLQLHGELLELHQGDGIGGVVLEADGVLHDVLCQEKGFLNVTHVVFLRKESLELKVWQMRPPQQMEGCSLPHPHPDPNPTHPTRGGEGTPC